jgi:hypothetical protein
MKLVPMTLAIAGMAVTLAACAPPPPPVVYIPPPPPPPPMAAPMPAPWVWAWSHGWRPCPRGYHLGPGGKKCWLN